MKLNTKILLFILSISLIIYTLSVGYITNYSKEKAKDDAISIVKVTTQNYATKLETLFEKDMVIVRTLADGFTNYTRDTNEFWKENIKVIYEGVFAKSPHIEGVWDSWELNVIDETWSQPTGRLSYNVWRENQKIKSKLFVKSLDGDPPRYLMIKNIAKEYMSMPYFWSYNGRDSVLLTDMTAPMFNEGKYMGLVGIDITSERCQELVEEIELFNSKNIKTFLIYTDGTIFASTDDKEINKPLKEIYPQLEKKHKLTKKIKSGKNYSLFYKDQSGKELFTILSPVKVGKSDFPWSLGINMPVEDFMKKVSHSFKFSIYIGILSILILASLTSLIIRNITNPLSKVTNTIKKLAKGQISDLNKINYKRKDEIGEIYDSVNYLINGLNSTVAYTKDIGNRNFESDCPLLSKDDLLGNSLMEMRNSLKKSYDKEIKRKIEDELQNWSIQGLAFLGGLLRKNADDIQKFSYQILSGIVKYIDANQGALYLINSDDKNDTYIEMVASFALDNEKYKIKKIKPGEGLVGRCLLEKDMIHMTKIPDNYLKIISGLGEGIPKSLLMVPLINNEEIMGAIEISSFKKFDDPIIEFIKKACKSIAASISFVKINLQTTELLKKSQQQEEEMSAQEEEMRQNMEELQATQEDRLRREKELLNYKEALKLSVPYLTLNLTGLIIEANEVFYNIISLNEQEIIGHNFNHIITEKSESVDFIKISNDFKSNTKNKHIEKIELNSGVLLNFIFLPFRDNDDRILSILAICNEIYN